MVSFGSTLEGVDQPGAGQRTPDGLHSGQDRWQSAIYLLALAVSIAVWFIAVRFPLWLDETGSYWQISAGFSQIWPRRFATLSFPAYSYVLWLWSKLFGTGEIAFRSLSILAMLAATWLLYRAAREIFDRDCALVAVTAFCLNPIVVFASIDVRPYAFGILATNAAIYILFRLRRDHSNLLAMLFGVAAACILYFHLIFGAILPALILGFIFVKWGDRRVFWRQLGFALLAFALAFLPLIPQILYLLHTAGTHVYEPAPDLQRLVAAFLPTWAWVYFGAAALLVFAVTTLLTRLKARSKRGESPNLIGLAAERWRIPVIATLALVPIFILFGVSVATPMHLFIARHRLVAVPGLALCWALLLSAFRPRIVRLLFWTAFVAGITYSNCTAPFSRVHGYTWKFALDLAEKNASIDNAPVLICSDFPESDYAPLPVDSPGQSIFFAQLSYYPLSVPVVPLPRALNSVAMEAGTRFLKQAEEKHERFLALAFYKSYPTLEWLWHSAEGSYSVRKLTVSNGITVLEFDPRSNLVP